MLPSHAAIHMLAVMRPIVRQPQAATGVAIFDSRYGGDPRSGQAEITSDVGFSIAPGSVMRMNSLGELQAAIEAAGHEKLVVLKFERPGCKSCADTQRLYASTARRNGAEALFFTVNCMDRFYGMQLAKASGIMAVPATHIYAGGELQQASTLSLRSWDAFCAELRRLSPTIAAASPRRGLLGLRLFSRLWKRLRAT